MEWPVSTTQLAALIALAVVFADAIRRMVWDRIERKRCPLPPGPTPLPFFGSVLSVNAKEPFRTYTEWRKKYGDIVYTKLLGMDVVVLNSHLVAADLLERRAQTYSNRPFLATVSPYGHDSTFAFSQYGDYLRLCRRIFHQTFRANAITSFHPMQLLKARQLVSSMVDDPDDFASHYTTFASSVTMCSIYGYDPKPRGDEMVSMINDFIDASARALLPESAALLNAFPFLLRIPEWFPGSWIKREARIARELGAKMVEEPYKYAQRTISKEDAGTSMVSEHIARMDTLDDSYCPYYEKALKETSSTAFIASVETTSSAIMTFTLAMVKNRDIWKRAQADIDAVVGTDRLPTFDDRPALPYVDAIMREALRWQPPTPVGIPHATAKSDVYNGFYIPKGATVVGNIWAMSRDETRYPNPERYLPERFIDSDGQLTEDKVDFTFGFGRRICPGRYGADASMWIAMATMLAVFDFNPAKDADGYEIQFEPKYVNGLGRHLRGFPCSITTRPHVDRAFLEQAGA